MGFAIDDEEDVVTALLVVDIGTAADTATADDVVDGTGADDSSERGRFFVIANVYLFLNVYGKNNKNTM